MKSNFSKLILFSLFCIIFLNDIHAQQNELLPERFNFEPDLNYDSNILSPAEFLGYELGEELTLYAYVEQYLKYVSEISDRVIINNYGETYEGRKLYSLAISSTENISMIKSLQEANQKLMDPVNFPDYNLDEHSNNNPIFVSYSYNIHGNETSSTEAAMQVLYRMAAANDSKTLNLLDHSVLIIYPCINADGRDRYVYWYKGTKRSVLGKEPRDMEHYAPFPNGRTNHYWFDLNRDWIWGIHPESRGHTSEYLKWMPQLHTDYHEMGYNSNYFTMPGTTPRNKLLPDHYEALTDTIGKANIAAFDEYKVNYFTREGFDFFYPGYGSSYPSVMGAIGMLVEQGGISGGRAVITNDGYVLTLRQRIYDHYRTSLATLEKAVDQKQLFFEYSRSANDPKLSKSNTKAYIIKNNSKTYIRDFLRILSHHGIEIKQLNSSMTLSARNYQNGKSEKTNFESGDYVVLTDQNKHLFIHSVMARNLTIEDSVMYDMATWSLPLAYNLDAYEINQEVNRDLLVNRKMWTAYPSSDFTEETYAVTIDWQQRNAPKALSYLWKQGVKVRMARKSFTKNGKKYNPGTLVILVGRNYELRNQLKDHFNYINSNYGVRIISHKTGRMDEGIDLASNNVFPLKQPKVAMLVGPPFSTYTSGQIYFLFDQETLLPIERVRTEILLQTALPKFGSRYGYADLFDYDVLILPGGGNRLSELFDEEHLKVVKTWIESGGTLVATESAANFFGEKSKLNRVKFISPKPDSSEFSKTIAYEDRQDYFGLKRIPGSALNSIVDVSNPLGFGLDQHLYTLKFSTTAIEPMQGLQSVVRYAENKDKLLVAGYVSEESKELLTGKVSAAVQTLGQGQIIFLPDNTQYRMFWRGPSRLMQNAVMLFNN